MSELKIKPAPDRVVVEPLEVVNKTAGGIIIPDLAVEKPKEGIVRAVGSACNWLLVGDKVIYNKNAGTDVEEDGVHYLLMKETPDVYAVI